MDSFFVLLGLFLKVLQFPGKHGPFELLFDEAEPIFDHQSLNIFVVRESHNRSLNVQAFIFLQKDVHFFADQVLAGELSTFKCSDLVLNRTVNF